MKIRLCKQPQKYLTSVDGATFLKLNKGIENIKILRGDIKRLKGVQNMYRYKISHYRILFEWVQGSDVITIVEINTRTNIKY